jgi:hypothetical protein
MKNEKRKEMEKQKTNYMFMLTLEMLKFIGCWKVEEGCIVLLEIRIIGGLKGSKA